MDQHGSPEGPQVPDCSRCSHDQPPGNGNELVPSLNVAAVLWSCFPLPALQSLQSLLALALYDLQCESTETMFMPSGKTSPWLAHFCINSAC